jgi:single-stranded-DNA-specific exonuclease
MPLLGLNRVLVKHSLLLANDEKELQRIPGLVALGNVSKSRGVSSYTYGFQWGPRLNATGRLEHAAASVKLLLSKTVAEAEPYAQLCDHVNTERMNIQEVMLDEAIVQAHALVMLGHKVIVVIKKEWHTGVVGIVASKIKDAFNRPAIVCGWQEDKSCWKGSGRSVDGFDLGEATESAVKNGILLGGGGHKMACGVSFSDNKVTDLRNWMNNKCKLTDDDFVPTYRILGHGLTQHPKFWLDIYDKLAPFGMGNPKPLLCIKGKLMWTGESKTRKENKVWAIRGGFSCDGPSDKLFYLTWNNLNRATNEWQKGQYYQMVVNVHTSVKESDGEITTYYNWDVEDSENLRK